MEIDGKDIALGFQSATCDPLWLEEFVATQFMKRAGLSKAGLNKFAEWET